MIPALSPPAWFNHINIGFCQSSNTTASPRSAHQSVKVALVLVTLTICANKFIP